MQRRVGSWKAWIAGALLLAAALPDGNSTAWAQPSPVQQRRDGQLEYDQDELGNQIPDFSHCGYAGADRGIPDVPVRAIVEPGEGDDGARIQSAIDRVAEMPLGDDGFRGAVQLAPGDFEVAESLKIAESGIVLRGSGAGKGGTIVVATGPSRRTLIRVPRYEGMIGLSEGEYEVADDYVPLGAHKLRLNSTDGISVGDRVIITRPSAKEWIQTLGMNAFGIGWRPGSRDLHWHRIVTAVDGETITVDAPITTAIERRFGGAKVRRASLPGLVRNVGIEDLALVSQPNSDNPLDEDHAWHGVTMEDTEDAWVRRIEFRGFVGGAVALWETTRRITVEDCVSLEPVSEIGGYRRHTFFTQGQLTLFLRCWSEKGQHDFAVGHCAAGPNAFVNCRASEALGDSGPLESWASGVLYDNVRIDGGDLRLVNRWAAPPGAGWSAANCVLWQCRSSAVDCFRPPTANNWALGCWARFAGDGTFAARSDFVRPQSLYQAQLRERVGHKAAERVEPILGRPQSATNPTLEEAAEFVARSDRPGRRLVDVICERWERAAENSQTGESDGTEYRVPSTANTEPSPKTIGSPESPAPSPQLRPKPLAVQNGWLVAGDRLVTGSVLRPTWWRGTIRSEDAPKFGPAVTRFVPGRVGTGFTDELEQVADGMLADGRAVYEHHYGLWYDRRRDDHLMVRRADGDVAPPFYEQPFARTGKVVAGLPSQIRRGGTEPPPGTGSGDPRTTLIGGTAWDGLSKYDLTKFNPWYWNRLRDFARLCGQRGLVLVHQNYFQHNILEAGAHWADCPWRPANNVNDTGLPEPPPYIGDKRIFMAPNFYDVSNVKLRELHRDYIRQCLDNFADTSNVIQMTSAEYSGPLEFTQFWVDTIVEWERERGRDVVLALSVPKNVQDAVLADPERGPHVDVIDIRYWAYTADGSLYAPNGGLNLAPRQHLRKTRQKPGGAAAIVRAVREYRTRYPDKAVIYNADQNCPSTRDGWATLIAGGSLADVKLPDELAKLTPLMRPADDVVSGDNVWCLATDDGEYLIYSDRTDEPFEIDVPNPTAGYRVNWIDTTSGEVTDGGSVSPNGRPISLPAKEKVLWLRKMD